MAAAALWRHFVLTTRLQLRHRLTLVYSFLFPTTILAVFWVLYRHETAPLARHLGEVLAVAALGGACFGLPATLVSEQARGVWQRFRLTPTPVALLVGATLVSRYLLLLSAGLLQVAIAVMAGAPAPDAPGVLFVAFSVVVAAFLGLGLLISTAAPSVLAAQALGQTVFLPMLILGGMAVPIGNLPSWTQAIARLLPGTYAVDALRGATGLATNRPIEDNLGVLLVMTAAAVAAAVVAMRWDRAEPLPAARVAGAAAILVAGSVGVSFVSARFEAAPVFDRPAARAEALAPRPPARPAIPPDLPRVQPPAAAVAQRPDPPFTPPPTPAVPAPIAAPERTWRDVTTTDIALNLVFTDLPPDHGVVAPISADYRPYEAVECVRRALATWPPSVADDPVLRVGGTLVPAAVADVLQLETERDIPTVVFSRLQENFPREDLVKLLYWVAMYPEDLDLAGLDDLPGVCLTVAAAPDVNQVLDRISLYATKFVGRLTGVIR